MASSVVLPSVMLYLTPRMEAKRLRATAWRWTRASKKCLSAARAWFLVRRQAGEMADVFAGEAGCDLAQLESAIVAPAI